MESQVWKTLSIISGAICPGFVNGETKPLCVRLLFFVTTSRSQHGHAVPVNIFPQQQHFAMGSLAQISSGAIRRSFNTRFQARFRRVQILRWGSGRFRWYVVEVRFRKVLVQSLGEVLEGSGAEPRWGSGGFHYITDIYLMMLWTVPSWGEVPEGSGIEGSGTHDTESPMGSKNCEKIVEILKRHRRTVKAVGDNTWVRPATEINCFRDDWSISDGRWTGGAHHMTGLFCLFVWQFVSLWSFFVSVPKTIGTTSSVLDSWAKNKQLMIPFAQSHVFQRPPAFPQNCGNAYVSLDGFFAGSHWFRPCQPFRWI